MNGHVYGLSEIVGTSQQGVDDAIRVGVQRAARTLRGLDWFEVTDIRGHLAEGIAAISSRSRAATWRSGASSSNACTASPMAPGC